MSNARNLSKFKPSSSGLVETADIADDAITTAKITDGNITTAKVADDAVTNAKVAADAIDTAQIADNAVANAQMADNAVGTSEIADDAVTTAKVNPAQTDITSVGNLTGLTVRNSSSTGPTVNIGTSSTSVADDGTIGTIDFTSGSSNTVNGRLAVRQYDTSENAGYFSHELRAPNGNSLGEISREFVSQQAHGGVYIKRPMPANIFYYRDVFRSQNIAGAATSTMMQLNQTDYYCSIACTVHIMLLDTNYPTGAFQRMYGLTANTHQGRSSWSTKYTSILDMGSYNQGANEIGSDNAYFNSAISATKSSGSNNGEIDINVTTGTFTASSCTIKLSGMFINTRFDTQVITSAL